MNTEELQSKTISFLRFPLTVGVVFIHFNISKGLNVHGALYGNDYSMWFSYIVTFFSDVLPRISVPLFYVISGFLFFYGRDFNKETYAKKLKNRVKSLLIPYFIWNLFAIVYFIIRANLIGDSYELNFSFSHIINTFFNNGNNNGLIIQDLSFDSVMPEPICGVLWYVRDLMIMVLLSPIIYWLIKRIGKWVIIALGLVWIIDFLILPLSLHYIISALFFFSWGSYYSINKLNFVGSFCKYPFLPLVYFIVAIIDTITKGGEYNHILHNIGAIIGLISIVILASKLVEKEKVKVNNTLANSSFFVFVLHSFILPVVGKGIISFIHIPDNPYAMLLYYFFIPVFVAFICFAIYMLLKRITPGFCALISGGR